MASTTKNQLKKALLPHLFFLRSLPKDQTDHKPQIECFLLRLFSDFLQRNDFSDLPALDSVSQTFQVWAELQSTEKIYPTKLATTIRQLKNGQHLPLLIRSQNACLLLSLPTLGTEEKEENHDYSTKSSSEKSEQSNFAVLSTFPATLPDKEVLNSLEAPTFLYPTTSVRVKFSSLLQSDCLAEQISYMDANKIKLQDESNVLV